MTLAFRQPNEILMFLRVFCRINSTKHVKMEDEMGTGKLNDPIAVHSVGRYGNQAEELDRSRYLGELCFKMLQPSVRLFENCAAEELLPVISV